MIKALINYMYEFLTLIDKGYLVYIKSISINVAIMLLVVGIALLIINVKRNIMLNTEDLYFVLKNKVMISLVNIAIDMFVIFNLAAAVSHEKFGKMLCNVSVLHKLIILTFVVEMIITAIRNFAFKESAVIKSILLLLVLNLTFLALNYNIIVSVAISLIYLLVLSMGSKSETLIKDLIIKKYGLMYDKDEYKELMKNVKIDD